MPEKQEIHPAFLKFIQICADLEYGTIERLQIQDGVPVMVETTEGSIILPNAKIIRKTKLV